LTVYLLVVLVLHTITYQFIVLVFVNAPVVRSKIQQAKSSGSTLKLSYTTIAFTGSAGAGKTNFVNLLYKKKFVKNHNSTGVAASENIISLRKAGMFGSGKESQWIELDHKTILTQLSAAIKNISSSADSKGFKMNKCCVEEDIATSFAFHGTPLLGKVWNMINLLDTGGQPEFISLFPAINNSIALTFIILNMRGGVKSLDESVRVVHSAQGKQSYDPYHLSMTNLDLIKLLMASSADSGIKISPPIPPNKTEGIEGNNSYQCYVGTHADKVNKKEIESIEKKLETVAHGFKCEKLLWEYEDNSILFPVDNTTAGSDKEDPIAELIRNRIQELVEKRHVYDVPIKWFILLLEIQKITSEQNLSFLLYWEVVKASKDGGISEDEEEIQSILLFFHMMGVLFYYHDVPGMCQYVITDHQWLFNKLTSVIKITFGTSRFSKGAIEKFKYEGVLSKALLQQIKLKTDVLPEHFIYLLAHLKIVAVLDKESYFMPCVLPSFISSYNILDDYGNLQHSKMIIRFSQGPLPQGFFCFAIVEIFRDLPRNWELPMQSKIEKRHTYNNLVTFHTTDTGHSVSMIDRIGYIEIQIRHREKAAQTVNSRVLKIITDALNKACNHRQLDKKELLFGFYCTCGSTSETHLAMLPKQCDTIPQWINCSYQKIKLTTDHTVWLEVRKLFF